MLDKDTHGLMDLVIQKEIKIGNRSKFTVSYKCKRITQYRRARLQKRGYILLSLRILRWC